MNPFFCSPWDEALARRGPPSVFLPDREGLLRFDADWTRDCWGRAPGPHVDGWTWLLLRDRDTGFVNLLLATSPDGHAEALGGTLSENLDTFERGLIERALAASNGNIAQAARSLGLDRANLHRKLRRFGILTSQAGEAGL